MLSHLLTQLLRSFGIFFRTIRAFFSRSLTGVWARVRRMTNFSRQATKVAADSLQSAAALTKKPTARRDYVETGRLFIAKKFLLMLLAGIVILALLLYFVVWPFILGHFLTARFYVEDPRVETWTGRVIVYADKQKTLPLYEGKLIEGLLQGKGRDFDAEGLLAYDGMFADGQRQGKGTAYDKGVTIYEGEFAAGVYEGMGKRYQDGALEYEGAFAGGMPDGEGIKYYNNGKTQYKGAFANGLYEGQGIAYQDDGSKLYEGSFSAGQYNGEGSLFPRENQRIDAVFADGVPDGAMDWYKNSKLYYSGETDGLMPAGYGALYNQNGKIAYQGQMANGTIDGAWLTSLTADEFRAALGEVTPQEYGQISGGFVIASPSIGLATLCSYQTTDNPPMVYRVYLSAPREERFALLPGQDAANIYGWGEAYVSMPYYPGIMGVSTPAGTYDSKAYDLGTCYAELFTNEEQPVLLVWSRTDAMPVSTGALGGAEAAAAAGEQARLDDFLASLGLAGGDSAASSAAAPAAENPYLGKAPVENAIAACPSAASASAAIAAMLSYWENAERRAAVEQNLARVGELLIDAQNAQAGGIGDPQTVAKLQSQQTSLSGQLAACTAAMGKASAEAASAGGINPSGYDLSTLTVQFDPVTLDISDLELIATAYAQATAAPNQPVDSAAIALSVKTTLADMVGAYGQMKSALAAAQQAAQNATAIAGRFATGAAAKADWYQAMNTQSDCQAALYTALSDFTAKVNTLNDFTGGWVSRTQGWQASALLPLYQAAGQPSQ